MIQRFALASLLACAVPAVFIGCLPDDPPVKGQLLYPGVNIERPQFVRLDGEFHVMFQIRRQRPRRAQGGVVDLHVVRWPDGTGHREILRNRSDRTEWPPIEDAAGARFYMVDERLAPNGLPVGTLTRLGLTSGVVEQIDDVFSYALSGSRKTFYYRKYIPGSRYPELHLRDLNGRDRNLGPLSGQVVLLGDDNFYFIAGDEQTLTHVVGFDGEPQPLRKRVSRFQLGGAEKFAVATVSEQGMLRSVVLDFAAGMERPLPVVNPCCWLDLRGTTFLFADSAKPAEPGKEARPAELHYFDVLTGADRVVRMPVGLFDVVTIVARPPAGADALAFDSRGNVALYRPGATPAGEIVSLRPSGPAFTPDGKYLLYLEREPAPPPPAMVTVPTGILFAQNAEDWREPPRRLSPPGASVPLDPKGYLVRERESGPFPLVFWARFGLGASDLYLGDWVSGLSYPVAKGIGEVSVSHNRVLGVMHMNQDLTGDLVYRDFGVDQNGFVQVNIETVLEHGVHEVEIARDPDKVIDMVAFVVRERMASSRRNGLWSTVLPDLDKLDLAPVVVEAPEYAVAGEAGEGRAGGGAGEWPSPPALARPR